MVGTARLRHLVVRRGHRRAAVRVFVDVIDLRTRVTSRMAIPIHLRSPAVPTRPVLNHGVALSCAESGHLFAMMVRKGLPRLRRESGSTAAKKGDSCNENEAHACHRELPFGD